MTMTLNYVILRDELTYCIFLQSISIFKNKCFAFFDVFIVHFTSYENEFKNMFWNTN